MQGYLVFLVTLAAFSAATWLLRDLIFGRPPADTAGDEAENER